MTKGVFIHRADSIYDDRPDERYQFPPAYLSRASQMVGDWVLYYEPVKAGGRGYYAAAKVETVISDPTKPEMYLALIEAGSFLPFELSVPFRNADGIVEQGLLNDAGKISGRAQSAVRPISNSDFNRIVALGLTDPLETLPRIDVATEAEPNRLFEERTPFRFEAERSRVEMLTSRIVRDRVFRKIVLDAYDCRCAFTGLKLINGGGRAEVEAAHIKPVEHGGPDIINNGLALSGTAHWMFDRGLITLNDEMEIQISRHINDIDSVKNLVHPSGRAAMPRSSELRPHPHFLSWHRKHCFKQ